MKEKVSENASMAADILLLYITKLDSRNHIWEKSQLSIFSVIETDTEWKRKFYSRNSKQS